MDFKERICSNGLLLLFTVQSTNNCAGVIVVKFKAIGPLHVLLVSLSHWCHEWRNDFKVMAKMLDMLGLSGRKKDFCWETASSITKSITKPVTQHAMLLLFTIMSAYAHPLVIVSALFLCC